MHQFSTIFLTFILITVLVTNSEAKRGCSNYGHSCFGGHGKRSELPAPEGTYSLEAPIPIAKLLQESNKRDILDSQVNLKGYENAFADEGGYSDTDTRYTVYELLKQWMSDLRRVRQAQAQQNEQQGQQDSEYMKNIDNRNIN